MYCKYKRSNLYSLSGDRYNKFRNIFTLVIKNAKRNYYSDILKQNRHDTRKTWQTINELLCGKKKCQERVPTLKN